MTSASTPQGQPDEPLAEVLGRIARELQVGENLDETIAAIVAAAVDTVPGAEHGGISEVRGRRIEPSYTDDPLIAQIDRAQTESGQGPCLEAAHEQKLVRVDDLTTEARWPEFTARARDLGVGSMMSLRLFVHRDNLGSLSLVAAKPHAFDDEAAQIGLLFATHAAIAMSGVRRTGELRTAIASRDVIGQAKGILMERHRLTADQAFAVLTRASTDTNRKLVDIAMSLTGSGELPSHTKRR
jgi:GAF domain-containing protein